MDNKGVCLVVGVGDGLGSAIARAFGAEGHIDCMTRRARHLDALEEVARFIREVLSVQRQLVSDRTQQAQTRPGFIP